MTIYLTVDKRGSDGAIQMSISDDNGGYRIAGPKYDGTNRTLLQHALTKRDVEEIRSYLRRVR